MFLEEFQDVIPVSPRLGMLPAARQTIGHLLVSHRHVANDQGFPRRSRAKHVREQFERFFGYLGTVMGTGGRGQLCQRLQLRFVESVYSTAEDTLRFLRALTRGSVFDDPATLLLMQQRWNRFGLPLDRAALRAPPWPIEYGLGMMRFDDPVLRLLGRLPRLLMPIRPVPAVIGHTGSTGCWLFHCPQLDLLLSGTIDQAAGGAVPFRLIPKILRIVSSHQQERSD